MRKYSDSRFEKINLYVNDRLTLQRMTCDCYDSHKIILIYLVVFSLYKC